MLYDLRHLFQVNRDDLTTEGDIGVQTVPGGQFAVSTHRGSDETLGETYTRFCGAWLPSSGLELRAGVLSHLHRKTPRRKSC